MATWRRSPSQDGRRRGAPKTPTADGSTHLVLRILLPDRPGALGAVAARIGAVGADITDVTVAQRSGGRAVDVFHLTLPRTDVDVMALLTSELREVDGAAIESWSIEECCGSAP